MLRFDPKTDRARATRWITPQPAVIPSEAEGSRGEGSRATSTVFSCRLARPTLKAPGPLNPKLLPLNYRHEEETGLYFAGDYNLRGRTPKADVDVCFNGNIAVSQVKLL